MGIFDFLRKNPPQCPEKKDETISFSFHTETTIPEYQGDYAKTVFLYWFSTPKKKPDASDWPKYFLYECGIRDCQCYFDDLLKEELLREAPREKRLSALKITDLKMLLSDAGLTTSGKKEQLIERVIKEVSQKKIDECLGEAKYYCLSPSGSVFMQRHKQYVVLHKHKNWGITWQEFDSVHRPEVGIYDTISGLLTKRVMDEFCVNLSRNAYYSLSECSEERGDQEGALYFLLKVLYLDLRFDPADPGIAPGIASSIRRLSDYYHLGMLDDVCSDDGMISVLSKDEFGEIVRFIIEGWDLESIGVTLKRISERENCHGSLEVIMRYTTALVIENQKGR